MKQNYSGPTSLLEPERCSTLTYHLIPALCFLDTLLPFYKPTPFFHYNTCRMILFIYTLINLFTEFWWDYFPMRSYEWRTFNLAWIKNSRRLLVVFYEDLLSNTKYELTRMIRFLGQPVQLHRMQCAMMHYASKQEESSYVDFDPTTPEQHRVLNQYIAEVNRELVARGSKPMPQFRSKD